MMICCCAARYIAAQCDILRAIYCFAMRYDMDPVTITCRRHISHRRYIAPTGISRIRRIHIAVAPSARQTAIYGKKKPPKPWGFGDLDV